jgi:hypothetical protein
MAAYTRVWNRYQEVQDPLLSGTTLQTLTNLDEEAKVGPPELRDPTDLLPLLESTHESRLIDDKLKESSRSSD